LIAGFLISNRGELFRLSGFIVLIITAIILIVSPLSFPSGDVLSGSFTYDTIDNTTFLNSSNYVVTTTYSEQNSVISNIISGVLLIVGFWGVVQTTMDMSRDRKDKMEDVDENY